MLRQRISSVDGFFKPRFSLAMRWALNTGEALAYLHGLSHPIIHRDLKPLNMFLTRSLEVVWEVDGSGTNHDLLRWLHATVDPGSHWTPLVSLDF